MAAPIFPPADLKMPSPDWGLSESVEANVDETTLGDGYVLRRAKGLNHLRRSIPVTWSSLEPLQAERAYDFLYPFISLVPVQFTHPRRGIQIKAIPSGMSITYDTWGNAILSVTLTEDFNPT